MRSLSWKSSGRKPQLTIPELAKKYGHTEAEFRKIIFLSEIKFPVQRDGIGMRSHAAVPRKLKYYDPDECDAWWKLNKKDIEDANR